MVNCPRCLEAMRQTNRMGVEIDYCPRCRGVWLDGGELEKLIERSQDVVPSGDCGSREAIPAPDYRYSELDQLKPKKKRKGFLRDLFDLFD